VSGRHSAEAEAAAAPADIRITGGEPTAEEIAAVTAVLSSVLAQLAQEERREDQGDSMWDRSRRAPRRGVTTGAWRSWGR
jgi:hypothetical protein